jgi:hypothetical protein
VGRGVHRLTTVRAMMIYSSKDVEVESALRRTEPDRIRVLLNANTIKTVGVDGK